MDTEAFEERAAIMEFCGGLSRRKAEEMARQVLKKPAPAIATDKATPGYMAFREAWNQKQFNQRR